MSGLPNGLRYPLVDGTRERHFIGSNFKPSKELENAQTPTTMAPTYVVGDRVHVVLGNHTECWVHCLKTRTAADFIKV
jgi:hypothetical protein